MFRRFTGWVVRDYQCRRFVEVVTDYMEGTMPARERARFERHVGKCEGCSHYLDQMRQTIRLTGRLTPRDVVEIDPVIRDRLLEAFREFHATG